MAEPPGPPTRSIPLDSVAISWHLKVTYGLEIAPATIRSWGQRGLINRRPAPRPLRTSPTAGCATARGYRYDLTEITHYLRRRGDIPE